MPAWLQPDDALPVRPGLASPSVLAAGPLLAPWIAVRPPVGSFSRHHDRGTTLLAARHTLLRMALPDFPGKCRLERRRVPCGPVPASPNGLRQQPGRAEITLLPVSPPHPPAP